MESKDFSAHVKRYFQQVLGYELKDNEFENYVKFYSHISPSPNALADKVLENVNLGVEIVLSPFHIWKLYSISMKKTQYLDELMCVAYYAEYLNQEYCSHNQFTFQSTLFLISSLNLVQERPDVRLRPTSHRMRNIPNAGNFEVKNIEVTEFSKYQAKCDDDTELIEKKLVSLMMKKINKKVKGYNSFAYNCSILLVHINTNVSIENLDIKTLSENVRNEIMNKHNLGISSFKKVYLVKPNYSSLFEVVELYPELNYRKLKINEPVKYIQIYSHEIFN